MITAELLSALHASLAAKYPARRTTTARPGRVTCVINPTVGAFEVGPQCDPWPLEIEVEVKVLAADASEKGAEDLVWHIPLVADLIRAVPEFTVSGWRSAEDTDIPTIIITATATGAGG